MTDTRYRNKCCFGENSNTRRLLLDVWENSGQDWAGLADLHSSSLYSVAMRRKAADMAREFILPHNKHNTFVKLVFCHHGFQPRIRARDSRAIGFRCNCNEPITALRPVNNLR